MSKEHEQRIYDRCIVRVGQLEAENAKLCDLVADLYAQLLNAYDPKELDEFEYRMHELGVEVG